MSIIAAEQLDEILHSTCPRVLFFKSLPENANLLDLGAGDGSLVMFRKWLMPERRDIKMFALSLEKGEHFDRWDGYETANFETTDPFAGKQFDAVFCAHFIEHIPDGLTRVIPWIKSKLTPGGSLYLELPSEQSKTAPSRTTYVERGIDVSCTNFFDDATHSDTWGLKSVVAAVEAAGLFVEQSGYWRNPLLEKVLAERGQETNSQYYNTMAAWLEHRFCQFVIASAE